MDAYRGANATFSRTVFHPQATALAEWPSAMPFQSKFATVPIFAPIGTNALPVGSTICVPTTR